MTVTTDMITESSARFIGTGPEVSLYTMEFMTPELLFLHRMRQLAILVDSSSEIDVLDQAWILRSLLVDQHPLALTVNTSKIVLEFEVGLFTVQPDEHDQLLILEDGLDPQSRRPDAPSARLDTQGFLNHVVLYLNGKAYDIRHTIKLPANVFGGVHHDPHPRPHFQETAKASQGIGLGGHPLSVGQLKAITRVTLRAMSPLVEGVKARS
ncbi:MULTISPECIES: hypothetical protein [unclassified Rhizobium]|uniref:hypothetical protein n=1 Tax=unclassified Rhizobium TaxID=2613769 RepID=UPI001ADA8BEE|nr:MULTISPECIES: hypothetical protein [unclassified Rhizobium]MBO9127935.1 hypothetical protein [Rhizobium sp. 16-488-2b]MBO9178512.1 hypothetical protein [Rhizobium sp. 16-488-2a]